MVEAIELPPSESNEKPRSSRVNDQGDPPSE
jgi:hypothetical protein